MIYLLVAAGIVVGVVVGLFLAAKAVEWAILRGLGW
jgi:uncharacterized protein YneF (UPF0154 family)